MGVLDRGERLRVRLRGMRDQAGGAVQDAGAVGGVEEAWDEVDLSDLLADLPPPPRRSRRRARAERA